MEVVAPAAPAAPAAAPAPAPAVAAPAPAPVAAPVAPVVPRIATPAEKAERISAARQAFAAKQASGAPVPQPAAVAPAAKTDPVPIAAPPEPEKKPEALAPKLAELAKRDRDLRAREEALKPQLSQLEVFEKARKEAALNPAAGLQALGLSLEQVIEWAANGGKPTAAVKESSEFASVRQQVEELAKARKEDEQRHQQAAIDQARSNWKAAALQAAKAGGETFELTSSVGQSGVDLALDVVDAHYRETGEVLPMNDALGQVERYYEQQVKSLLTTKKVSRTLSPPAVTPPSESGPTRAARTLSNSAVGAAPVAPSRPQTLNERIQAAAEVLRRGQRGG